MCRGIKTKREIVSITVVLVLLIAVLIDFGITQNVTERDQNITLPENVSSCEYVAELNKSQSESLTNAPVNRTQTPDKNTYNTSVIGLNWNYTINESTDRIGDSLNDTGNNTAENTTEYITNDTELLNIPPKLVANKNCFSLDEDPAFSLVHKTFEKSFIKNASPKTFEKSFIKNASPKTFEKSFMIETCVYDSSGILTDIKPEIANIDEGEFAITVPKERAFRAGLYKLSVELVKDERIYVLENEFLWGLVSLNTRKSIYKPGETAEFVVVALDKDGHSVCNSDISVTVTNPNNDETTYSTAEGTITPGSECGIYSVDYAPEVVGNYTVCVTSLIDNVEVAFDTYFQVWEEYEFEITRTAQSRIDPTQQDWFDVTLDIQSFTDANAVTLREFVPAELDVFATDAATVRLEGDTKTITWTKDLTGNKTSVNYSYAAPPVWPYLYALGPAEISYDLETFTFVEARPWYVAVDPITVIDVQSYPAVGGKWTVRFCTTGTADLTITAVNGTTWTDQPYECYGDETEVQTKEGWKLFKDLKPEEEVLTLNPETKAQEWQKSIKYQEYDYSDAMFELTLADGSQLLVSQEHKVYGMMKDKCSVVSATNRIHTNPICLCFSNLPFLTSISNLTSSYSLNCLASFITTSMNRESNLRFSSNDISSSISRSILPTSSLSNPGTSTTNSDISIASNYKTGSRYLNNFSLLQIYDLYKNLEDEQLIFLDQNKNPVKVKSIKKVPPYTGKIYGVTVPNRILIVRRGNSTPVWCGNSNFDLQFVDLKCGEETLEYEWKDNSVFIENYTCNLTGHEVSKVLSSGPHTLEFRFGSDVEYAHNWATDFSGWGYRQLINISNTGQNLSNYQVRIDLNSSNVGTNWNWSNDGEDTRFTYFNSTPETETGIPFWIEYWNSTANTATIWVNVTSLKNNMNTTIYMYYGNSSASSASNGTNTFEFFDDLDNINNWEKQKFYSFGSDTVSFSTSNSKLVITSTGDNRAGPTTKAAQLSQGQKFEARMVTRSGSAQTIQLLYLSEGNTYENIPYTASNVYEVWIAENNVGTELYDGGSGSGDDVISYPYIEYRTTDYVHFGTRGKGEVKNTNSPWDNTNFKLAFYTHSEGTLEIDWGFVRKYAFPEPSVSIGSEKTSDTTPFTCPADCECFVVGADSRTYYDNYNKTLQFIKPDKDEFEFAIWVGDMEYVLVNKEIYCDVELSGLPSYWVVGNHEMDVGDEENISNLYSALPNTVYYYDDTLRTTYIAEYDKLYIVILDEYREYAHGNIPENGPQYLWLEEHLALLDPAKKIFAFGHEPAYPEHAHIGDSLDQFPSDRDALWSMFDKYSVEAYFCGHTHWYSMNDSMLNVTQVDIGNMRWWGDGNSTLAYVAVNDTTSMVYIYSNTTKGTVLDLIDSYEVQNSYYTQTTIFVNTSGWWRAGGSFHSAADPIKVAEANSNEGDTIFIYGGDYNESITVLGNTNLSFVGEGSDVVNITGTTGIFDVRESYINISRVNLTVASAQAGVRLYDTQHCHLDDIKVSGGARGIQFYGASYGSLKNTHITGCSEAGIELTFRATSNNNATWNLINNCTVTNCVASNGRGIYLIDRSSNNTISNCTVTGCYRSGLYMSTNADYNTIRDNVFNGSTNYYGIRTNTASHNNIINNYMCNNYRQGLYLFTHADWNNITDNIISNNNNDGIYSSESSNNTFIGNRIENNSGNDIYLHSSSNNTLADNTLNGTMVSFTYGGNVTLKGVGSPAEDANGWHNISKFISATSGTGSAWLYLNFSYSNADVSGLDESSLKVWKHNASGWFKDGWNGTRYLDTAGNVVGVNITSFSVFAPMATSSTAPTLEFVDPTPANNTNQSETYAPINISIATSTLDTFKFNWNTTNYTFYNSSLILAMNLNNNSAIGEDATHFVDISKYGNNGSCSGNSCPTFSSSGKFGAAYVFDGSDDLINCGNASSLNITAAITIEAWAKISGGSSNYPRIVSKQYQGPYELDIKLNEGGVVQLALNDTSYTTHYCVSSTNVSDGEWHHLAGTWNGSVMHIYVDGELDDAWASSFSGTLLTNNKSLWIGSQGNEWWQDALNGTIDEVRIYNRALSTDEIWMHYKSEFQKYNSTQYRFYNNITNLTDGTYTYYGWANDTAGNENYTINYTPASPRYITIDTTSNNPPNQPTVNTPTPSATNQNLAVTLNVTVTDPDGDSMNVSFYNNATGQQINITQNNIANGSSATLNWTGLNYSTTYYWYANATDGEYTNKSEIWNFTTKADTNNPPNFTLNYPQNNSTDIESNPVLNITVTDNNGDSTNTTFWKEFISISAGGSYTCGVLENGSAMCWGDGSYGRLGYGGTTQQNNPVYVNTTNKFISISAGGSHTCGLLENGSVMCWGDGGYGRLGYGGTDQQNNPIYVNTTNKFVSISAGTYHTCGVLENGSAMCWGYGANGQLGYGGTGNQHNPVSFVFG